MLYRPDTEFHLSHPDHAL
jgi:hypothetical protein